MEIHINGSILMTVQTDVHYAKKKNVEKIFFFFSFFYQIIGIVCINKIKDKMVYNKHCKLDFITYQTGIRLCEDAHSISIKGT